MAIMQAQTALTNAEAGLSGATTDAAMLAAYRAIQTAADNLVTALSTHGGSAADIAAAARKSGNAKAMADDLAEKIADAEMEANMAMAATAAKLYAGISAPTGDVASPTATDRAAAYNTEGTAILVSAGLPADAPAAVTLSEDKKTMVAANHGWAGKRYAGPDGGDMYEAMVYSNVGEPTMGKKFGSAAAVTDDGDFQYQLADGSLAIDTSTEAVQMLVASSMFDHSAGTKEFEKGDNEIAKMIPGSYHGVSGTYSCTPSDANTNCSATVAADGFTLQGGAWTFKPPTRTPGSRMYRTPSTPPMAGGFTSLQTAKPLSRAHSWTTKGTSRMPQPSIPCRERQHTGAEPPASTLSAVRPVARTTLATSPRGPRLRPTSVTTRSRAPSTTSWARTVSRATGLSS